MQSKLKLILSKLHKLVFYNYVTKVFYNNIDEWIRCVFSREEYWIFFSLTQDTDCGVTPQEKWEDFTRSVNFREDVTITNFIEYKQSRYTYE
jgi:hypothetical protein